jgi:hypothetical protein
MYISLKTGPPHRFIYRDNQTADKIREIVVRGHVDMKQHGYLQEEKQKSVGAIREPNYGRTLLLFCDLQKSFCKILSEKISMLCRAPDADEIRRCINRSTFYIDDPSTSHEYGLYISLSK